MIQNTENDKIPFKAKIANFLQKNRKTLIFTILGLILVLGGIGIYASITVGISTEYAKKIEKIQQDLSDIQNENDEIKRKSLSNIFEKELTEIITNANLSYGLLKAYFISGNYKVFQKKWVEAAEDFSKVYFKDPKSYLSPISLANQASCLENSGNLEKSIEVYDLFEKNYSDNKVYIPEVWFNKARLLEKLNQSQKAIENYKKLIDKFPESNWTKLARDRIITLENK